MTNKLSDDLVQLKKELQQELANILQFWIDHAVDKNNGGFYGKIDDQNIADPNAPKGLVLNARILWTFSAAFNFTGEKKYLEIANRAFDFLTEFFHDLEHGGFYWSIDKVGNIVEGKKQVYGIAFCLYAFAEHYKSTKNNESLSLAKDCYRLLEKYSFDRSKGGYLEAFTREWQPIDDPRLSDKDANTKKTMNTHLHVLEAYSNLYSVWKNEQLKKSIVLLLENFTQHIIDNKTSHLQLFFDEDWQSKGDIISYGHDIEAAWLLLEAARVIEDQRWIEKITTISLLMSTAAEEGLDDDGGLWYERERGKLVKEKHWWPQAEALVGFFNAWQLSGDKRYLQNVLKNWRFTHQYILDTNNGEWFWGVNEDYNVMDGQDKIGFWKCPYHNSRACMEIIEKI